MSKSVKKIIIFLMAVFAMLTFVFAINSFKMAYAESVLTTDAIVVRNGAEVRLDDQETEEKDETGIRFTIDLDTSKVDELLAENPGYIAEYGVALLPTRFLQGQELDVNGTYVYNEKNRTVLKIALVNCAEVNEGIETYFAVLTNIPSIEYETDVTARAFIKLTNGESVIYKQAETSVTRSIGQVLTTCYNNPEYDLGYDRPYYEQLLTQNLGTVSFEKENYTLFKNDVNDKTIVEGVKVYGNKYGFELDLNSEYLDENAISLTYGTDGVANYDNGAFAPVSRGTTTVDLTVGGKTASTTVKVETEEDLALTLGAEELAAFDHQGYATMIEVVKGVESEIAVGDYYGKEGVLKVSGTIEGGMSLVKLVMPVAKPGWTDVTFQMYVEQGNLDGLGSIGISVSDSAVSWGDGSVPAIYSGKFASNCWFNVCLKSVHENVIYLALSPLSTQTGSYFTYYVSTIMSGNQTTVLYAEELQDIESKTTLDWNEVASFDVDEYKNAVKTSLVESPVIEVLSEYEDANGNVREGVLHLQFVSKATGLGTNTVEILLPKTISGKATIEYQISINQTAGTVYDSNVWGFLSDSGWGALQGNVSVTTWSTLSDANFGGLNSIKLGFNQWDQTTVILFDLYISQVISDVNKTANRELYNQTLCEKLVDNQLATFNELAYVNYVEGQDLEIFEAEIIDDTLGEKGKVLHVTAKPLAVAQLGTPRIVLFLPKAVTTQFTLNYRVTIDGADDSINAWGIMWPGASAFAGGSWDLGLKPCSNVEQWTNNPVGGGYAGLNYIVIGLNQVKTYDFYFSSVVEG